MALASYKGANSPTELSLSPLYQYTYGNIGKVVRDISRNAEERSNIRRDNNNRNHSIRSNSPTTTKGKEKVVAIYLGPVVIAFYKQRSAQHQETIVFRLRLRIERP